jgi:SAM-dependent methyltransferase
MHMLPTHPTQAATLNPALEEALDVSTEISPNDPSYSTGPEWYYGSGRSALQCIRLALLAANIGDPKSVLDFGSGHGRILRFLKAAFAEAELTACDINPDAIEFCAEAFGATPVLGRSGEIDLVGSFDLIWSGSVFTHVQDWQKFLRHLNSLLMPEALLVFTTGGREVVGRLRSGEHFYNNLSEEDVASLLEQYDRDGFGYIEGFPTGCGFTLASPDYALRQVTQVPGLRIISFWESGWNSHQDVVAVQKTP